MSKNILICEDDNDIVDMVTLYLQRNGHKVRTVNNCEAIWDSLVEGGVPDLILMDFSIPTMGGAEATQRLKAAESTKDIQIVLMSAFPGIPIISRKIGADGYLAKPFEITDLKKVVEQG